MKQAWKSIDTGGRCRGEWVYGRGRRLGSIGERYPSDPSQGLPLLGWGRRQRSVGADRPEGKGVGRTAGTSSPGHPRPTPPGADTGSTTPVVRTPRVPRRPADRNRLSPSQCGCASIMVDGHLVATAGTLRLRAGSWGSTPPTCLLPLPSLSLLPSLLTLPVTLFFHHVVYTLFSLV